VRYETTGDETRGPTRTVVRVYALTDDGGLALSRQFRSASHARGSIAPTPPSGLHVV
jgi:hypothetical protein